MLQRLLLRAAYICSNSSTCAASAAAAARTLLVSPHLAPPSKNLAAALRQHSSTARRTNSWVPAPNSRMESSRRFISTGSSGAEGGTAQVAAAVRKARLMAAPVGAMAGLFGSVVGVGGGVVIVPLIVNACKTIPQRLVSGTSLVAVVSTAVASSLTFAQAGLVDVTAALLISPVAMLAAPAGARATARLDTAALKRALGWFLIGVAPLVPLKAYLLQSKQEAAQQGSKADNCLKRSSLQGNEDLHAAPGPAVPSMNPPGEAAAAPTAAAAAGTAAKATPAAAGTATQAASATAGTAGAAMSVAAGTAGVGQSMPSMTAGAAEQVAMPTRLASWLQVQKEALLDLPPATAAALCATGAVAGFASGLLGIGGGTIVTPMLALLSPFSQSMVVGTSLLSMLPPSLAGLVQHQRLGNVDWRMAAGLAAGTALGAKIGSAAAVQAPSGALEAAFTLGMLFLGRKTLRSARA